MKNTTFQYQNLSDELFLNTYGGRITAETSFMYDVGYVLGALVTSIEFGFPGQPINMTVLGLFF